nr:hypothetical protein [Tanacetum cinerariifolium]
MDSDQETKKEDVKKFSRERKVTKLKKVQTMPHGLHIYKFTLKGLDEIANKPVVENSKAESSQEKPKEVRKNTDAPIIKKWVSDDEGNMSYLTDYKEINRGYVAFGGNPKGEKIIGTSEIDSDLGRSCVEIYQSILSTVNEITNFLQKPNETFNEAWERFKDFLRSVLITDSQSYISWILSTTHLTQMIRTPSIQQSEEISWIRFPANVYRSLKIAASLDDKLDIRMNHFKKSLNDMKNSFITPTTPLKAVEE